MQIKLINCNNSLLTQSINMQAIGSGSLLNTELSEKFTYESWEYDFNMDTLLITVLNGTAIPDMSMFGELVINGSPLG